MTANAPLQPGSLPDTGPDGGSRQRIGTLLRRTREAARIELQAVAAALCIRAAYLQAIEQGAPERLPGRAYAVGFVRAYAEYLGLDGEEAVRRFKREGQAFEAPRDLAFPIPPGERRFPATRILVTALVLAICGYGLWYYEYGPDHPPQTIADVPDSLLKTTFKPNEGELTSPGEARASVPAPPPGLLPPPPGVAELKVETGTGALTPTNAVISGPGGQQVATLTTAPDTAAPDHIFGQIGGSARIVLRVTDDCWVQIKDGKQDIVFGKLLHAGDVYRVPDQPGLSLRTGNSDGLAIFLDGKPVTLPPASSRVRNIALDPARLGGGSAAAAVATPIPAATPTVSPPTVPPPPELD